MVGKTEAILIRRGLSLYKQPLRDGGGSPYWYARVYMPLGGRSIHAKSTGTTNEREARKRAEAFWEECVVRRHNGERIPARSTRRDPNDGSFDHVAERWLANRKLEAGSDARKLRACQDDSYIYLAQNGLAAFFGHIDVRSITTDQIREFLRFQVAKSVKGTLAATTQKRTLVTLRCILKSAYERQLLLALPLMPKLEIVDNPRPYFTRAEYRRLYVAAWARARKARDRGDQAEFLHWMEIADFVIFMVSTFLRPSEWKAIRHKDVVVVGGPNPHLMIANVQGKTGIRTVHSMPAAVGAYRRLHQRSDGHPEAFVFKAQFENRQTAGERMRDSFERLLRASKLKLDATGNSRVTYSLRHSSIMFRLLDDDNVSPLLLAKAAGTSVDQIERFYGSHLEVGMKLRSLHGILP